MLARSTELAGATDGQAWFFQARTLVDEMKAGICRVDFADIRIATVSWLREAVIGLNRYVRSLRPDLKLVLAGLSPLVYEELRVALDATGQVAIIDESTPGGPAVEPTLVGHLDLALREAFRAIEGKQEFDASTVCDSVPRLALSAANNRLAALEDKGVLVSERRGRSRVYRTVLENLRHGH